jgi:acyl-homoserine lactone acylase PvdQ
VLLPPVVIMSSCAVRLGSLIDDPDRPDVVADDPALAAWSVLPPGNGNVTGFTSAWADDQRGAYDRLDDAVADGTLTDAGLGSYFVDARMGAGTIVRTDNPASGVSIGWDDHGIPHVRGEESRQVAYGAGWAVAEARLTVAELGRILGRAGTIEMAGGLTTLIEDFSKLSSLPQVNYTDAELEESLKEAIAEAGEDGPRILEAIDGFVDGLNAWIDAHPYPRSLRDLGLHPHRWNRADVIAVGNVVDDIFGSGGGAELENARFLRQLQDQVPAGEEAGLWELLRMRDEPQATPHVDQSYPYPLFADSSGDPAAGDPGAPASPDNVVDPAAVALPDTAPGSVGDSLPSPVADPVKPAASNFMLLGAQRSASGHPILVGGPQSSYFAPQLLFEMELQGGGYDARGITFPGLGPWVVIGRSRHYAWTATAGGSDLTDQRVELLCEPEGAAPTRASRHYLFQGECRAMTRPDGGAGTAWRTVHGPVVGTGTVDGRPVAFSRQRSSRGQAAFAARAFWRLNQGEAREAATFAEVMADVPMSFNWAYLNATDIAYFHSGWYPVRARGVDPDLPSWGTGEWEWRGRIPAAAQPQVVNPPEGFLVSWNNTIAPGWQAADNDWGSGGAQRVDLLARRAAELHGATPADVVAAVQDAATVDLRGELLAPTVLAVLEGPAPTPALQEARDRLSRWVAAGAHRRDRDADGFHDDPTVALMDALWLQLVDRDFAPGLGPLVRDPHQRRPKQVDNPPSMTGGAYAKGWYSLVEDDLRAVTGATTSPAEPWEAPERAFCGGGDPAACREVLWQSLTAALWRVGDAPSPTWKEQIRFLPILTNTASMRWQNRPTWQQVMSFESSQA